MKSVLISIRPKWCEKIVNGEKTIEVRKTAPKEEPFYFECLCEEKGKKIVTRPPQSWCYVEELCKAQN